MIDVCYGDDGMVMMFMIITGFIPRAIMLHVTSNIFRNHCRVANKADVVMGLKTHKKMFYYSKRIWRNKIISDGIANTQDDYVYYYIHPFGRLGRLNSRATMTEIRACIVDDDFLLHGDMEKLL
jgi:hypothetical protein